jgi:hypothetical protein
MKDVNEAYKRWAKERSDKARKNWYRAVRRFHEVHSCYPAIEHQRSRHRKSKTQARRANCDGIANAWVDVNMKYHNERNGDPKLQGWYDAEVNYY